MITIIYEIPDASLTSGIRTAFELYVISGFFPKVIADNNNSILFNAHDAHMLIDEKISESDYIDKHKI